MSVKLEMPTDIGKRYTIPSDDGKFRVPVYVGGVRNKGTIGPGGEDVPVVDVRMYDAPLAVGFVGAVSMGWLGVYHVRLDWFEENAEHAPLPPGLPPGDRWATPDEVRRWLGVKERSGDP